MKTRNIFLFLIVFSLFTVGATTEDPRYCGDATGCICDSETFTEGAENYIKVRCEPEDTSATMDRLYYLDCDRNHIQRIGDRLTNNDPCLILSDQSMTDIYELYEPPIFSDGTFGFPTNENWEAGTYELGVNCTASGLNYSCIHITIDPTSTTEENNLCGSILDKLNFLNVIPSSFKLTVCSKSDSIKEGVLFPVTVFFFVLSVLGFMKLLLIDAWFVWILLIEAFICVYAFQQNQYNAFGRFRAFISMNIQVMLVLKDIVVQVGGFVLDWTFGLLRKISPL